METSNTFVKIEPGQLREQAEKVQLHLGQFETGSKLPDLENFEVKNASTSGEKRYAKLATDGTLEKSVVQFANLFVVGQFPMLGSTSVSSWMTKLETYLQLFEVPAKDWPAFAVSKLTSEQLMVFLDALTTLRKAKNNIDWHATKDLFMKCFANEYYAKWLNRWETIKCRGTVTEYVDDMKTCAQILGKDLDESVEHFKRGLPSAIQESIRTYSYNREVLNMDIPEKKTFEDWSIFAIGIEKFNAQSSNVSLKSGLPKKQNDGKCHGCGQFGHFIAVCPLIKKEGKQEIRVMAKKH